jgi:hypothetical protein
MDSLRYILLDPHPYINHIEYFQFFLILPLELRKNTENFGRIVFIKRIFSLLLPFVAFCILIISWTRKN